MAVDGVTPILEKLSSMMVNEITLVWDFNDELKNLQKTLSMILAVMKDAEKKQESNLAVRIWMEDLKAIAYDAEDILDEYCYEVILWKRENEQDNSTFFNKVCNFFEKHVCNLCSNSSISFVCSWNLARQIKKINERLFKLCADSKNNLDLHRIDVGSSSSSSSSMNRETYSRVSANWKIVGRDDDKSKIINTLLLDKDLCSVFAIVGLGGMGKTTLAQLVYNDEVVQKHFQERIWICVSNPFDVKKLLKNIVNSMKTGKNYDDASTMEHIVLGLQDALRKKKFLLVLDDVWNENHDDWYNFKTPLMVGAEGSKILVTTRSMDVASLIMIDKFMPPYPLGILNHNDSWSLFKERAFGSADGAILESPKFVEIGNKMVERCGGLPLAVIFLGSLMRTKKKEKEWENIRDTKIWHESQEREKSEHVILLSLRLSYDHLPSHLKQCFSYCCLFPKDWEIKRETLIRLWMAEGFIIKTPGENAMLMEEIGDEYFHNLLCYFFFQDVEKDYDGEITTCKMHDLVHDLARSVVGKNECLIVESADDIGFISEATRRLNLVNLKDGEMLPKVLEALKKAKNLRTVFVNKQKMRFDIGNAFKENKRLRVLDLSGSDVTTESTSSSSSSSIGELKHLRYLDVGRAACFSKEMIGRSIFLQTLSEFNVGDKKKNENACGIEEMQGLNFLSGKLTISDLDNVTSVTDAYRANLKEKNLGSLSLSWRGINKINNHEAVLEGLLPHPNLRTLAIDGYHGAKLLPRMWIEDSSCLSNLVKLELFCRKCEQLAGFGALPSLRYLTLNVGVYTLERIGKEFYYSAAGGESSSTGEVSTTTTTTTTTTTKAFPLLKFLHLYRMRSLKEWVVPPPSTTRSITNYCFPLLEEITVTDCPLLSTITPTTTMFPSLKVLKLKDMDGRAAHILVTNNLNSLTSLSLWGIPNLITLPCQGLMENNNTLLSLHMNLCFEFEGFLPPNKDEDDQLQISQVVSSTSSSSSSSSSLQSLMLSHCPALRLFPNIHSLTSLQTLVIVNCKEKESRSFLDEHVKILKRRTATTAEEV